MTPSAASQQSQPQSKLIEGLHPPLRNALSSLNINLDYELARYRYAKQGAVQPSVKPPQFKPRRRSLSLINVPSPPPGKARTASPAVTPPPPPPNPRIHQPPSAANVAVPPTVGANPMGTHPQPMAEVAALRSAIVHQPTAPSGTDFASSEALLESGHMPYSSPRAGAFTPPASKSWLDGWNTPLGMGILMLLLVGSAGFGFVLVNPYLAQNLFSNTPLAQLWTSPENEATAEAPTTDLEEPDAAANFEGPPLNPLSPDLSRREFTNLELNNLSNLPSGSPRPPLSGADTAAPGAEAAELGATDSARARASAQTPATAGPSTRVPQEVNQIPQRTIPAPQSASPPSRSQESYQAPAATPQPAPAGSEAATPPPAAAPTSEPTSREPISSYYVVTDYTGDPSLEKAREIVGDAYVRNFETGARIQLGAFNTAEGAADLVEELESQGIDVQIYEP